MTMEGSWYEDRVILSHPGEDRRQIAEAVEVARLAPFLAADSLI